MYMYHKMIPRKREEQSASTLYNYDRHGRIYFGEASVEGVSRKRGGTRNAYHLSTGNHGCGDTRTCHANSNGRGRIYRRYDAGLEDVYVLRARTRVIPTMHREFQDESVRRHENTRWDEIQPFGCRLWPVSSRTMG